MRLALVGLLMFVLLASKLQAQDTLDPSLHERVEMITKPGPIDFLSVSLETTIYQPEGSGPFPVVVINHGKAAGNTKFDPRYRPVTAVRYFLQRGYAVVVPMRQGFSKSGGTYIGAGCNIESNGLVQAEDVKAVLDYVTKQPWADRNRLLIVGQSHGGWTTLAFGSLNYPGVKGLVNFAGGLRDTQCPSWEAALARAAASYAKSTQTPSIWFYGDNDSYFSPYTFHNMFNQYVAAGGNAKLVAYGSFGSDAHALFGSRNGEDIWGAKVSQFLESVGLTSQIQASYVRYAAKEKMRVPPPANFASLKDQAAIPFVTDAGRVGYQKFLERNFPRAFAIAPNGAWGWSNGGEDPLAQALSQCNKRGQGSCSLYAVDDAVVWVKPE